MREQLLTSPTFRLLLFRDTQKPRSPVRVLASVAASGVGERGSRLPLQNVVPPHLLPLPTFLVVKINKLCNVKILYHCLSTTRI